MPLLEPGQPAPSFRLPDQRGTIHTLEQYRGRRIVLYFYPEDDTPKCTDQACGFRDAIANPGEFNAVILGVSPDGTESHAAFADKFSLPFALLADVPDARGVPGACNAFGTWVEKNMYGKKFWGVARVTYLIDERGVIARRWGRVIVDGHAAEVLAALRGEENVVELKPGAKKTLNAKVAKGGKKVGKGGKGGTGARAVRSRGAAVGGMKKAVGKASGKASKKAAG
jgi:peroxiredoxin Q/BCP